MANDHDRAEFVRRLVLARCPELSADEIAAAFADDETGVAFADDAPDPDASVAEIANAISDAMRRSKNGWPSLKGACRGGCIRRGRYGLRWVWRQKIGKR
jgi:hypothetical protein